MGSVRNELSSLESQGKLEKGHVSGVKKAKTGQKLRWRDGEEWSQPVLGPAGAAEALCPSKLASLAGSLLGPSPGPRGQEA